MDKFIVNARYWVTPNFVLNSNKLSFKAKWIFGYIQSKPPWWKFSVQRMKSQSKDWPDWIRSWIIELEEQWLLTRRKSKDEHGNFTWVDYILTPVSKIPTLLYPEDGKSEDGEDNKAKPQNISKKDLSKKEVVRKKKVFTPPTEQEVIDYFKKNWYMISQAKTARKYYDAWDWEDARWNKVKNRKQKMISVRMKDEYKEKKAGSSLPTRDSSKMEDRMR